ncbi:hypothetical protein ACPEEZ_07825 [Frigoribacterium sp. 2-23]|uniref:hypothetical protein n=1 Tax=Frigoribacterium sp. 2-23 TaxID=3415006 RepID=UPI003C6F4B12
MPEPIERWWARRRWSRGADVPYAVGTYREAWAVYPVLVRQYHPDLNAGVLLTQIPPMAEVWLCWQCDVGHVFVATPAEQRSRPGRERRRSSWCPDCAALAKPQTPRPQTPRPPTPVEPAVGRAPGSQPVRQPVARATTAGTTVCPKTPRLPTGEPFASACAPKPASAVEADIRQRLAARLDFTPGLNAIRLGAPFFDHVEAWPDIVLSDLRVAIEYDSIGRHGLEHVGRREAADRRKDRALRAAGWEVVRLRGGKLQALGPYDLLSAGATNTTVTRLIDVLRDIRGPLMVDAYLR